MMNAILGIGTNIGHREENLKEAVIKIKEYIGSVIELSSVYETEPWGFNTEDQFLNMVVMVDTGLSPAGLLEKVQLVETLIGRVKSEIQYTSRVIDIDILFFGDQVVNEGNLIIPHPHIQKRRFVLVPLCEIAPELIHPVLNKTVATLLESCTDSGKVIKV
jgi:2-amino-4-hydroxy-6-hydroxymethyldihydropteridine diphosphokinase